MSVGRHRLVAVVVVAVAGLSACSASEPGGPTAAPPSTVTSAPTEPPAASPSAASPSSSGTPSGSPSTSLSGVTLRQLGFANGPSDEFSLPSDLVLTTSVDQPNVVTLVLARPSPQTVEEYLRATLPGRGFTIDARADVGQALAFAGHGWTGVFTGTGTTTAIVLRPA
ncbi:hypothetical protein [Microlunatus aurantiacus]|uniref:hypothetical protein n=1 Tax=Microlunatus aurantiacus TaxID=446786 RepID=UPI0031DEAE16